MTQVTVDNTAVSEQVSAGNSTSVPTGEVWKVTIVGQAEVESQADGGFSTSETSCSINGEKIASSKSEANASEDDNNASASASTTFPFETVVVDGDTISASGGALHVGGFVVNG